jgi:hypothetical protein
MAGGSASRIPDDAPDEAAPAAPVDGRRRRRRSVIRHAAPPAYVRFLSQLKPGQTVTLPLEPGEQSRHVIRQLNLAASQLGLRLIRLPDPIGAVRFRVAIARPRPTS